MPLETADMVTLESRDGIHVLVLGNDENRFSSEWIDSFETALDRVVESPAPLVTVGEGKYYSNGLDLDWVAADESRLQPYVARVQSLLARVLTLGVPTVAAVNGHAFGAGAMLAMAHDWRVMRSDRGYFCFPEVDIRIPFTSGMAALIQAKLTPRAAVDAMTTGRRWTAPAAAAAGLVDGQATQDELLDAAVARVAGLENKDAATLAAIKVGMFGEVRDRLESLEP